VACRLGVLYLPRQVLERPGDGGHVVPGNDLLPEHAGMVITRGLREWACLLPLDVGFETTQRLLGWITQEAAVISTSEVRTLVREHGKEIREAEAEEVAALLSDPERLARARAKLVKAEAPRRLAAWPKECQTAVEAALDAEEPTPPVGVSRADWERVLTARREQQASGETAALRRLGPEVAPDQIVVGADEVLVRKPQKRTFFELRTARVQTQEGVRHLSGSGQSFLQLLWVVLLLCGARARRVTLVADGARWIREFVEERLRRLSRFEFVLDWFHVAKRTRELTSMIGGDRASRRALCKEVLRRLWQGAVADALAYLESYRPRARSEGRLEELIEYLRSREASLVDYRERRRSRQYIGSGGVEKANDQLVARRMKRKGMHWSPEGADRLAALKTLWLNQGWDLYWSRRTVLPLVGA
jgi:hypothetical protein